MIISIEMVEIPYKLRIETQGRESYAKVCRLPGY